MVILMHHLSTSQSSIEYIGQFHPIFLHFPIVLFTLALIFDLRTYFLKGTDFTWGNWFVIAGVVACIPTIFTGLVASMTFDPLDPILQKHETLAYTTAVASSLYAGFRIAAMWWKIAFPASFYVGFSVLLVALVSWTADYGGLMTRLQTPFSSRDLPQIDHNS